MKERSLAQIVYMILISLLLVLGMAAVAFSFFSDMSNEEASPTDSEVQSEAVDSEKSEGPEAEINNPYMSEGYPVEGGSLHCSHYWNDWILTRVSTLNGTGNELRYCQNCSAYQNREIGWLHGTGEKKNISDIKCILQMPKYPNGCEIVSLTMVLRYYGYDVTTDQLIDNFMPRGVFGNYGDDPFHQYLGDPRGLGVGCYAPCIVTTANAYLNSLGEYGCATDVSGQGFDSYKRYIDKGKPVIFWGTTYMDCNSEIFGTIFTEDREIIWRNHSHCFVMIGYTDTTYIFCDPLRGVIEYPKEDVEKSHGLVYEQACVLNKTKE